jgi:hypothetical protein
VSGHGWLLILSPHVVVSLMLTWNLGLEIVAIHPDSGEILGHPAKRTAEGRQFVITGLDPVIHLL